MSDDTDTSGSVLTGNNHTNDCSCGGCGTGTTCCHETTTLKAGSLDGVYAYAGPLGVFPDGPVPYAWPNVESGTTTITFDAHTILKEELLRDLLERVQKLEKKIEKLRQQNLDFQGSLDALVDIMDDTEPTEPDAPMMQLLKRLMEEAEVLLAQPKKSGTGCRCRDRARPYR